jgi:hypothetical protein
MSAYSVKTLLDDNILIDKQRVIETHNDTIVHRIVSGTKTHLFLNDSQSNNNSAKSFTNFDSTTSILLADKTNGDKPIAYEDVHIERTIAKLLVQSHNIYLSTYRVNTLYANAWSNTIEVFTTYNGKEIILARQATRKVRCVKGIYLRRPPMRLISLLPMVWMMAPAQRKSRALNMACVKRWNIEAI